MSTSSMPYSDAPRRIAAAFTMPDLGKGQWKVRSAFPEVVIDRSLEVSKTRSTWLVHSQDDILIAAVG